MLQQASLTRHGSLPVNTRDRKNAGQQHDVPCVRSQDAQKQLPRKSSNLATGQGSQGSQQHDFVPKIDQCFNKLVSARLVSYQGRRLFKYA